MIEHPPLRTEASGWARRRAPGAIACSNILLAESDPETCLLIKNALSSAGFEVACTSNAADTLESLDQGLPTLLLLDVDLPDRGGAEVLTGVERIGRRVPYVVLSGVNDARAAVDYFRRGARDVLLKDTQLVQLVPHVVTRVLEEIEVEEQRKRMQTEILEVSEREQRRIGQDLHDDLCQRLAAIKMQLQHLSEGLSRSDPEHSRLATVIARHLSEATRAARSLARGLSPVDIGHEALPAALSGLARNAEEVFQITCDFHHKGGCPGLNHHVATQIYRIAQEGIANAVKHARATAVSLAMDATPAAVVLTITNDGDPFPTHPPQTGVGLPLMKHRAESIGATMYFLHNPPDGGTSAVHLTLPLK
ncbi:MAG: response regulator [Verrucomicrobiales bacterium]